MAASWSFMAALHPTGHPSEDGASMYAPRLSSSRTIALWQCDASQGREFGGSGATACVGRQGI